MESERLPTNVTEIIEANEFHICIIKPGSSATRKLEYFSQLVAENRKELKFEEPEDELDVGQLVSNY